MNEKFLMVDFARCSSWYSNIFRKTVVPSAIFTGFLVTIVEANLYIFKNSEISEILKWLRIHGHKEKYNFRGVSFKSENIFGKSFLTTLSTCASKGSCLYRVKFIKKQKPDHSITIMTRMQENFRIIV